MPSSRQPDRSKLMFDDVLNNSTYSAFDTRGLNMISLITMKFCGGASGPTTVTAIESAAPLTGLPNGSKPTTLSVFVPAGNARRKLQLVSVVQLTLYAMPLTSMIETSNGARPVRVTRL